ncbi:doublecortin domain-containing protein [Plasmodium brasilianum]|uniref:Apicortin, putative n=2 Tax=Plasmodium (Plasmodium) TaxID=418103 RepID=A0A1D3RI87_PLAMA|nr:apicortin, putative [Plasmodium malariae]KAI4837800.1 doublecortin domain-containing protein [Plasmodium brasilianum]SCN44833.1 apicortin, putative [Plasmodium malariae]
MMHGREEDEMRSIKKFFCNSEDYFLRDNLTKKGKKKSGMEQKNEENVNRNFGKHLNKDVCLLTETARRKNGKRRMQCYKDVFDRLTDTKFYTGTHKKRFDDSRNGGGTICYEELFMEDYTDDNNDHYVDDNNDHYMDDNNDHYMDDNNYHYMSHNNDHYNGKHLGERLMGVCRTRHDIYSYYVKRVRSCTVVTPGTLGIQKYGIQIARPKTICLYLNRDKYHNGLFFFIKPHVNNWKCFLFEITKVLSPIIGPIRKVYDQNFRLVKSVEDLIHGAKYLCTSGDPPASLDTLQNFLSKWILQI